MNRQTGMAVVDPENGNMYAKTKMKLGRSPAVNQTRTTARTTAFMFVAVFVGGAAGSLLREAFSAQIPGVPILTGTFGINIVACFILGWLYAIRHRVHAHVLHLGAVGFCGGLSTFSSFVAELERLALSSPASAISAAALEIAVGLAAAVFGEAIGRRIWRSPE
ncbi:fluoride efflux transporter FluC [Ruegeria sp.]|uniref:fluoride efflux transporter FluC n=1 Tax=Ruegeria sp. TaxID=1879320 RepID=UPI003B5A2876